VSTLGRLDGVYFRLGAWLRKRTSFGFATAAALFEPALWLMAERG